MTYHIYDYERGVDYNIAVIVCELDKISIKIDDLNTKITFLYYLIPFEVIILLIYITYLLKH